MRKEDDHLHSEKDQRLFFLTFALYYLLDIIPGMGYLRIGVIDTLFVVLQIIDCFEHEFYPGIGCRV